MPFNIHTWAELAPHFRETLLLGNGASIAVSSQFSYSSLLMHAIEKDFLVKDAQLLFDFFNTQDFELILRIVWQASNVNRSLKIEDNRTHEAYVRVRNSLIEAVQSVHPEYDEVREHLPHIYEFLKGFDTVVSLNYDLIVYWATTYGLDMGDGHAFKDCFVRGGILHDDWASLRRPIRNAQTTTLVFYPHGSLILCRNRLEQERKIHNLQNGLLEAILEHWRSEEVVPLFVSEGTSEQKIASIQNSFYLSTVYREVLPDRRNNLTIYGWGFGEHDQHLLTKMAHSGVERVAVSVYGKDQGFCRRASGVIYEILGYDVKLYFFDSQSPGCWNSPK